MKYSLTLLVLACAQTALLAQGTLYFYNHVPAVSLDAPVFDTDGTTPLFGYQFQAQLFAGPAMDTLQPIGPPAYFGREPGYWFTWGDPLDRIIPNVPPGEPAFAQVKVWSFIHGSTYDQVAAAGGKHGQSPVFSVTPGGGPLDGSAPPGFPTYLTGLPSIRLTGVDVPEPSTLVLALVGSLALGYAFCSRAKV